MTERKNYKIAGEYFINRNENQIYLRIGDDWVNVIDEMRLAGFPDQQIDVIMRIFFILFHAKEGGE